MNKLLAWLDDRTGIQGLLHEALYERIPGGARWRYVWGSTLVFTFSVQMITGIFLWTAYSPSAQTAWESVYYIQEHMTLGWFVRGLHHFSAQAMVVLLGLHLMQVVIDGAYRAPREVNFWLGIVLLQIVLGLSLTGYLLPWDQKGYYATQVSTKIARATPVVGPMVQEIVQGGKEYGHHTLTRFFALHAGILPGLLIAFLGLHIYVFRRHGITVHDPKHAPDTTFWPDQVLKDAVACLAVLGTVMGLTLYFHGAELSAPADPAEAYSAARPEWYFLFLFRFLRFEAVEHFGLAFGAIYVPGALFGILVLMPIVAWFRGGHRFNVAFMWGMLLVVVGLTALAFREDGQDADHQAAIAQARHDAERIVELANGPDGIPAEGAVSLKRNDPFLQGPRIFKKACSSCHRHDGHDGMGRPVMMTVKEDGKDKLVESPAGAADLGTFGTRDWVRKVLLDYATVFAPLRNAKFDGVDDVGKAFLDEGQMSDWSKSHAGILQDPANKEQLDALVEFVAAQGDRADQAPFDANRVALGRKLYAGEAPLAKGEFAASCVDCHSLVPRGETERIGELGTAPELTKYGSAEWLRSFLKNPGAPEHYGSTTNAMPAFETRLSPKDVDLLVRWMTGDYYRPEKPAASAHAAASK